MKSETSRLGILILAGGRSSRMGKDKALLLLDDRTFIERIVEEAMRLCETVVISVACNGDDAYRKLLMAHPRFEDVIWAHDVIADQGPMGGIAEGLKLLENKCTHAFVMGCDVPVVKPALVRHLFQIALQEDAKAVVPIKDARIYGMTAVYKTDTWPVAERLLLEKRLRVSGLADELDAQKIDLSELTVYDPRLESFQNINHPEDYRRFLSQR